MKRFFFRTVGDGPFYRMVFTVALPIMIQNFITNFVSLLDNIMVGSLGTEQFTGVAIVNQILFIYNLTVFGVVSGIGIFTAQFYGQGDREGLRHTLRFKLISVTAVSVLAFALFSLFGDTLISLFLHQGDYEGDLALTFSFARQYLDVMLWQIPFFMLIQCFSSTMRETGSTVPPMVAGLVAVAVNFIGNLILIFGLLGAPALGVVGAAIATLASRVVEVGFLILYLFLNRVRFPYVKGLLAFEKPPRGLIPAVFAKGTPLMLNECFWSMGMSLLSVCYSLHGVDVVAAYSITSTVTNLLNISFMALGISTGIIIGNKLGENRFEEAYDIQRKLMAFSILVSIVVGLAAFGFSGLIVQLFKTGDTSRSLAAYFLRVASVFLPVHAIVNNAYFTLRSGGRTFVTFLFDSLFVCLVQVPLAFAVTLLCRLDIHAVYPIVLASDLLKVVIGLTLIKKKIWLNNIVTEDGAPA